MLMFLEPQICNIVVHCYGIGQCSTKRKHASSPAKTVPGARKAPPEARER
jgi:hypothetical protein